MSILIVYVLLRLPGIAVPLDRDEGAFGYIGQVINRGGLPYLDALDHKPPVAFYINALALHFVQPTPEGVHLFLLVYNLLTLICVFFVARIYFRSISAAFCAAFAFAVFSASPAIHGFTAGTEMYALLPTTLSLLLAVYGVRKDKLLPLFLSGIAGAVACWTKQTAFTSVLFVFLFLCIESLRGPVRNWKMPALWLSGAVLFSAALVFYFYARGIFKPFIYWCFTYELAYARVPLSDTWQMMRDRFAEIVRGDFILPAAGLAAAVWSIFRKQAVGYFLAGFLVLSFTGTIPGYTYPHYFVQLAPSVAMAGGYAFSLLLERRRAVILVCGLLVLAISIGANRQYFLESDPNTISRYYFGDNPFPEAKAIADFIAVATSADDRVLILGSEPEILFYAQRRSPTPFVMIYPLTSVHDRYKEFQETLREDVQKTPPKYVVDVSKIGSSIAWDGVGNVELLRNLRGFIAQHYRLVPNMPNEGNAVDIYRLTADRAATVAQ